jgi:hypothetical protein
VPEAEAEQELEALGVTPALPVPEALAPGDRLLLGEATTEAEREPEGVAEGV